MSKTITFKPPPRPASAEEWVRHHREPSPQPDEPRRFARFTIDVPVDLHRRIKSVCAQRGLKMADVLREQLEREFPAA